jgi:2-keto-4-pentenoate hydratase/2-oxohepta-3-ene-1,7-dioic acid hydratase in catechol pathway
MRLVTVLTERGPRACVEHDGRYVDVQAAEAGLPESVRGLLEAGPEALAAAARAAERGLVRHDPASARLGPPVVDPRKVICLGLNYRDHAIESKMAIPEEPVLFNKFPTAVVGPGHPIELPEVSDQVDYEAELVVVIGRRGRDIDESRAMEHVAGYTVGHDVSARDWQLHKPGKQWLAGKTFDTFAPIGPALVTADEVSDPHALGIRLRLNGETMQDSTTAQLIFGVPYTIAYLSRICTLEPGDLIFTGTPPGVGMARTPPVWLKAGDVVEVEIGGLGVLRNPVTRRS